MWTCSFRYRSATWSRSICTTFLQGDEYGNWRHDGEGGWLYTDLTKAFLLLMNIRTYCAQIAHRDLHRLRHIYALQHRFGMMQVEFQPFPVNTTQTTVTPIALIDWPRYFPKFFCVIFLKKHELFHVPAMLKLILSTGSNASSLSVERNPLESA